MALKIVGGQEYDPFKFDDAEEEMEKWGITKQNGKFDQRVNFHVEEWVHRAALGLIERGRTPFDTTSDIYRNCLIVRVGELVLIEQDADAILSYEERLATARMEQRQEVLAARVAMMEGVVVKLEQALEKGDEETYEAHIMDMRKLEKMLPEPWNVRMGEKLDHYKPGWRGPEA